MNPLLARPARVLLYLSAWLALGVGLAGVLVMLTPRPFVQALEFAAPLAMLYGAVCLGAWWVCRSRPIDGADGPWAALAAQALVALTSAALWAGASLLWSVVVARAQGVAPDRVQALRDAIILFLAGVPLYLVAAASHYVHLSVEATHAAAERALASQVAAREAELRALRAQLNPHFLFNSLNSINALIGGDPEGARRMCEGLGDFLRRTLQLGTREAVTLSQELALVDRYLAIEQVRFGERLQVTRDIDPLARECLLPPLLLQPLVENAVKHGIANRIEGGTVQLLARVTNDRLVIELENPVDDDFTPTAGEGLGLDNVQRRLEVLGDRGATLSVRREPGRFHVTLSLPVRMADEVGSQHV